MQQLPLNVTLNQEIDLDSFLVGKNHILLEFLRSLSMDSHGEFIYLWGAAGVGKSHLLQGVVNSLDDGVAMYLPMSEPGLAPEMLQGLAQFSWVVIDDCDDVLSQPEWQEALFHLYNQLKDIGANLLIAAKAPPAEQDIQLKDLKSRLTAMTVFKVQPLSDSDKMVLIQQKAAASGLALADEVAAFMLNRSSRDLRYLLDAIDKLDKASLVAQRPLTVPFVKEVLGL
ncbi:DnaA regulatory inactivator Hda [Pleionea sp. CnH1-48]|uniref:DnaA regulatory inactivator Hda n=1 Tax=Pleionea sp. CnH1-48 TaxID=2954494 RepID=UPI002096A2BB|nr:DnaA regulatory inactivator Hda [Pleionea sp. CnH1-48]MCO7222900.1 DnaA regulatory inactivator Hda [Pleionea sp. CnH1-48]